MYLLFLRRPQQPPQAAPSPPPPPPAIQRPRRRHNMWVRPWLLQREEGGGGYHNIMAELYATDIPGFTNFMRMTPKFFEMIKTRLEPHLTRQATNYRTEFRIRWNVPHALGALDGKHVALKKPKNSGALYHNYKGFFSIVMLALVDGQYKFRWVDVGTVGSCLDAQLFNTCHLKKIKHSSIGFPDPAPITQGGRDVPYFILADDAFALKTWLIKPLWQKDVNQIGKDCQLQNIKGQESC